MNLDAFLHDLHFDIDKVRPMDVEVDWQDAPLTFKIYRGLPVVPLSPDVSLTLEGREVPSTPNLRDVGDLLWYVYGLSQFCQSVVAPDTPEQMVGLMQSIRRFVPSGGALYPNELYVYLKLEDLPSGIYHYDVAHHRLLLLRAGNFDSYLVSALGSRCDMSTCFAVVFVSTLFWKNFFKYHNFAYRLQGLDAGVLLGQLLEVAKRYGFTSAVYFQFLDRAVNHLLGLSAAEESVYAMMPLSITPVTDWLKTFDDTDRNERMSKQIGNTVVNEQVTAINLCRDLPEIHHTYFIRSRNVLEYPMLIKMNEASMLETFAQLQPLQSNQPREKNQNNHIVVLPKVQRIAYDLVEICRKRYSPGVDFQLSNVSQTQLAALLQEATTSFAYHNDIDGVNSNSNTKRFASPRVFLYGCLYRVDGIPDGAYRYDSQTHTLHLVQPGDHRSRLQDGMTMHNVNLSQVPICLHVVGETDYFKSTFGYRGYRIQQMEVGMLLLRLLLAATALGMGGHPLLGFEASICDQIYKVDSLEQTCLIQIPIGFYRSPPRLEGRLQ